MEEPLYQIHAPAPERLQQVKLSYRRTKTQRATTMISEDITEGEYRNIFGPDRNMQSDICHETQGRNGYAIRMFLPDVLACEGGLRAHQARLINHILKAGGAAPLDEREIKLRARDCRDITLQAADALLRTAE